MPFRFPAFVGAVSACGGDDNKKTEPQLDSLPAPDVVNKYAGRWQSGCVSIELLGMSARLEVVFTQIGSGQDLQVHEKGELFTDLNCRRLSTTLEGNAVLDWLRGNEPAELKGRKVLADAYLAEDCTPKYPHDWTDLHYLDEKNTLWRYTYDDDGDDDDLDDIGDIGRNEFVPLYRVE